MFGVHERLTYEPSLANLGAIYKHSNIRHISLSRAQNLSPSGLFIRSIVFGMYAIISVHILDIRFVNIFEFRMQALVNIFVSYSLSCLKGTN
jgi:hypothetical protein